MKILKKVLVFFVFTIMLIYIPTFVQASELDERILEERRKVTTILEGMEDNSLLRIRTDHFNHTIERSLLVSYKRSSINSGINMETYSLTGNTPLTITIFEHGTENAIRGSNRHINPGKFITALNWTANELGNNSTVDIFFTFFKDVTEKLNGAITY